MTTQLHHIERHKNLLHRVKDEKWTTLLKNTGHFLFDYNSGVSWSIFILFELVETGMNILQISQQNLQHHPNCVSTLPNVKTAHFETTMADRFGIVCSIEPVVCKFRRKPSNVHLFNLFCTKF